MADESDFLGTGWAFPPTFEPSRAGTRTVSGVEDIDESLRILLSTRIGERVMQPTYGSDLTRQLFEPMNASLLTYVADVVRTAIVYHEPRIKLERVKIQPHQAEGRLDVVLDYLVRTTNTRYNTVFPFYLTESSSAA